MSRPRSLLHEFLRGPSRPTPSIHRLLCHLHHRQHCPRAPTQLYRSSSPPRRTELWKQRHCRTRLCRGSGRHHICRARHVHGDHLAWQYPRSIPRPNSRRFPESVPRLAGYILASCLRRSNLLHTTSHLLSGDLSHDCRRRVNPSYRMESVSLEPVAQTTDHCYFQL